MTNGILYPVPKSHTHTVYLHYILTSKHMPLIHLSKGLVYCSYFILILFLIISTIIISVAAQRESNGLGGGGDRDTVREESKVGSV